MQATPAEIVAALARHGSDDCEIDADAEVSHADEGYWVAAWVWVPAPAIPEPDSLGG